MDGNQTVTRLVSPDRQSCPGCGVTAWLLPVALSVRELEQIELVTEHRRMVAHDRHLIRAGDTLTSLFIVNSGSTKTTLIDEHRRTHLIGFALPGEILGMEAIDSGRYSADVIALEDTSCCGLRYADLIQLCKTIKTLQHHVHRAMSLEINRGHGLMLMLGSMTGEERLVSLLLSLSTRYAARGYSPTQFRLRMTREDIGNYLGLRLETISRLFNKLKIDQLVAVDGRAMTIKNLAGLWKIHHKMPGPRLGELVGITKTA